MGSAKYIGRVGALAVGLGVGVAIAAGGNGIAFADDTDSNDSTGTTSSESDTSSSDSDSESSSSTSVGATDNDTAGTPKLTSPGRFHRPTSKVTGGVRLVIDDQDLTQPRATTSRRSAESPRRSSKSTVTPDDESLTDIDDSPSTKGAQREEATVEPLETVTPAEPASIPDLSVAETAVTIETTVPEPLSPPPATATTTVAAVPIDILTPRFGRTGPFQPAGPSPSAALKVAAVRRLLDEAVAENDPRQSGATTQTTTSGPGAAATGSTVGQDIPDLLSGIPFQSVVGPDNSLYRIGIVYDDNGDVTTNVTKISPSGRPAVEFNLPGTPGLTALVLGRETLVFTADGRAHLATYDGNTQLTTITTIAPTNQTSTIEFEGIPLGPLQVGPNSRVYQAAYRYDDESGSVQTIVRIVGQNYEGEIVIDGVPALDGGLTVAPDGTLYVVTSGDEFGESTTVTVFTEADDDWDSVTVTGRSTGSVVLGADGTAYIATDLDGVTLVYSLSDPTDPIGGAVGATGAGALVVAADGTVYLTTSDSESSWLTVVRSGAEPTTITMAGVARAGVAIGPDGTVYQVTIDEENVETSVTSISPSGQVSHRTIDGVPGSLLGYPTGGTVVIAPDGTAYLAVMTGDSISGGEEEGPVTASVTVVRFSGSGVTEYSIADSLTVGDVVIGSDGRAYLVTIHADLSSGSPNVTEFDTVVRRLDSNGSTVIATFGQVLPWSNLVATTDNKAWLLTRTIIASDGGEEPSYDDRAALISLGSSNSGGGGNGGGGSSSIVRQIQQVIDAIVAIPVQIVRAALDSFEWVVRLINDVIEDAVKALDEVIVNLRKQS